MALVFDSGPLISLARIGQLDLLPKLFGEIVVPSAVYQEVTQDQSLPGALSVLTAEWVRIVEVSDQVAVAGLSSSLDPGESEVLLLARELRLTAAIDERRARQLAVVLGISQTGTVGILLAAKRAGLIASITPLLDQLTAKGVRLSSRLYEEARSLADEI